MNSMRPSFHDPPNYLLNSFKREDKRNYILIHHLTHHIHASFNFHNPNQYLPPYLPPKFLTQLSKFKNKQAMDWYKWLSKTNLDPTLVYEYGLLFARNELQEEDLAYFNHEFLQSIGIAIAKHRLEILKLARKDVRGRINGFSKLMNKTRRLLTRNFSKLGFYKNSSISEVSPYRNQWSGALRRINGGGESQQDQKAVISDRSMMWSGPLDKRAQEKFMFASRNQSVSGPLDVKVQERIVYPNWSPMVTRPNGRSGFVCRSPTISGPIDRLGLSPQVNYYRSEKVGHDLDHGAQSLWSIMFQDLKPT